MRFGKPSTPYFQHLIQPHPNLKNKGVVSYKLQMLFGWTGPIAVKYRDKEVIEAIGSRNVSMKQVKARKPETNLFPCKKLFSAKLIRFLRCS